MKERKLKLSYIGDSERRGFLYHEYEMCVGNDSVGECFLKEGDEKRIMTLGNVGYYVNEEHRGHSYAAAAIRELVAVAPHYSIKRLVICCRPDNTASFRSCEKAGARFDSVVELNENDDSYAYGTRFVKRYFLDVPDINKKQGENL